MVCTIHQPSESVFRLFTHLLLLKKGGEVVYFGEIGENYAQMRGYFEGLGYSLPDRVNPADWMLEICKNPKQDLVEEYKRSELYADAHNKVGKLCPSGVQPPTFSTVYATPVTQQIYLKTQRDWKTWWRNPELCKTATIGSLFLGLLMGTTYWQVDDHQSGVYERQTFLYFSALFSALGSLVAQPVIFAERAVFFRERAAGSYRSFVYLVGLQLTMLPWNTIGAILYASTSYWMTGLRPGAGHFAFFTVVYYVNILFSYTFSQFLAFMSPSGAVAAALNATFNTLFNLFGGFLILYKNFPVYWIWMFWVSPVHYTLEALAINEFLGQDFYCDDDEEIPIPVGVVDPYEPAEGDNIIFEPYCTYETGEQVLDDVKGLSYSTEEVTKFRNLGILLGMYVGMIGLGFAALKWRQTIKR